MGYLWYPGCDSDTLLFQTQTQLSVRGGGMASQRGGLVGDALLSGRHQSVFVQHLLDLFTNQMLQHTGTVTFSFDAVMLNISRRGNYQVLEVCFFGF